MGLLQVTLLRKDVLALHSCISQSHGRPGLQECLKFQLDHR